MLALLLAVCAAVPAAAQPRKAASASRPLTVDGVWIGQEVGPVGVRHPIITFTRDGGTLTYDDASGGTGSLTLRLQAVTVEAARVRFAVPGGGKLRHYSGRWDGRKISGTIAGDASGEPRLGRFELRRPIYDDKPVTASDAARSSSGPAPSNPEARPPAAAGTAALSDVDSARKAGRERLEERLGRLSDQAGQLLQAISEWQAACQSGGAPLWDQPPADCDGLMRDVGRLAIAVGTGLDAAEDEARRSWVEPGVVRELRAQHGLDQSKWDELSSRVRALEAESKKR